MNQELIRIVDGIARDKNIEREQIYTDIEQAIASGLRKQFNTEDTSEFTVAVDRTSGEISVTRGGETLPLSVMGFFQFVLPTTQLFVALLIYRQAVSPNTMLCFGALTIPDAPDTSDSTALVASSAA